MTSLQRLARPGLYAGLAAEAGCLATAAARLGARAGAGMWRHRAAAPCGHQGGSRPLAGATVVLVHGYGGTDAAWAPLRRRLAAAGVVDVHPFGWDTLREDIPTAAARLSHRLELLRARATRGHGSLHLVGHSLGGIVVRYAAQRLGWQHRVASVVTVAAPHGGSPLALLGPGPAPLQVRPGSALLAELDLTAAPGAARWLALCAELDVVVPVERACLATPPLAARNAVVADRGHMGVLRSATLGTELVRHLAIAPAEPAVAVAATRQPAKRALRGIPAASRCSI